MLHKIVMLISSMFLVCLAPTNAQNLELVEGQLELTTFQGLGPPQTASISNQFGSLILNPASGGNVKIDIAHDLELMSGDILLKGNSVFEMQSVDGDIMAFKIKNSSGGLTILSNGYDEAYFFDDDENYISIGMDSIDREPTLTHLDIFQDNALAIRMKKAGVGNWSFGIRDNGNLGLFYNGFFRGEFSSFDGDYSNIIVIEPKPNNSKNATSKPRISLDQQSELISTLLERVFHLEKRIQSLEQKVRKQP